jgi:hypothetical protein
MRLHRRMVTAARSKTGKLFELMSWLELEDAANDLSTLLNEEIGRDDILRLGLEAHLILSVRFLGAQASVWVGLVPGSAPKSGLFDRSSRTPAGFAISPCSTAP